MTAYRLVAIAIILFVTFSTAIVVFNFKNLSMAIPANLEKTLPATPYEGWREFTADQGGFSVKVPAIPQNAQETVQDKRTNQSLLYDMYVAEKWNGALFTITVIHYPKEVPNLEKTLKDYLGDIILSNPGNELVSAKETSFQGKTALSYKVQNPKNQTEGILVIDGKRIFFIGYITDERNKDQKDYEYFINSFKIN